MYKNIGQLCLEKGLISEIQLKLALEHQKKTGLLLGAVLVKLGYVTNQEIMALLSEQREWYYNETSKQEEVSMHEEELPKLSVAFLDIITTGINPDSGAEIAQLGIVNLNGIDITDKFVVNIKTKKNLTDSFKILYKIKEDDITNAKEFKEIIPSISKHLSNKPIFSFNIQSVINFIIHYFERARIPFTHSEFYDLLTIWRRLNPNSSTGYLSLLQMAKEYQYPLSKPYNIDDSLNALVYIYGKILDQLRSKHSIKTLSKLQKFQDRQFKFFVPEKNNTYFLIEKSIMLKRKLEIDYFSPWKNSETVRNVDPYELINQGNEYYLIAYCNLREEVRWFRLDRIKNLKMLDDTFEKKDYNLSQFSQ